MKTFNSYRNTMEHIEHVGDLINEFCEKLYERSENHDQSKLNSPEKEILDQCVPILQSTEYKSDLYNETIKKMEIMTKHHYEHNRHHMEHFEYGINDMNLVDIIEMICDWKSRSKDIIKTLDLNNHKMTAQLYNILKNTFIELGWVKKENKNV